MPAVLSMESNLKVIENIIETEILNIPNTVLNITQLSSSTPTYASRAYAGISNRYCHYLPLYLFILQEIKLFSSNKFLLLFSPF